MMLLALLLLASPVDAQEAFSVECNNIKDSVICDTDDDRDTSWDFLDNFTTRCDSFYGCGLGHDIIKW